MPPLLAALTLLTAGAARAQNGAAPPQGTGGGHAVIGPAGNAPSSVDASGTVRVAQRSDPAPGANSLAEGEARHRTEGAGLRDVGPLTRDANGLWRCHGQTEGRPFDVGFDDKGQVAVQ